MAMRLHELHPSLSHYPVALLPVSVGCDICGVWMDNENYLTVGRMTMPMMAASAAVAGVAGILAQEEVIADDDGTEMLKTHRNLNLATLGITSAMAVYRLRRSRPSWTYLSIGVGATAMVAYSAYLGGKMVYQKGMGVKEANGVLLSQSPELVPGNGKQIMGAIKAQLVSGIRRTISEIFPSREIVDSEEIQRAIGTEMEPDEPEVGVRR